MVARRELETGMKPTCDLYDDHLERLRVLPAGLRLFGGRRHFHGPAETVKCFEDNSRIKDLAAQPGEGRVIVADAGGSLRCAVLGDMIAGEARAHGWAGVVIWGAVRDAEALAAMDFGVAALGTTPRKSTRRGEGQAGIDIVIGGVPVRPGDMVVADADGVVILPAGLTG